MLNGRRMPSKCCRWPLSRLESSAKPGRTTRAEAGANTLASDLPQPTGTITLRATSGRRKRERGEGKKGGRGGSEYVVVV
jgi:hypothetical protein